MNTLTRTPDMDLQDFQLAALIEARRIGMLDPSERESALRKLTAEVHALKQPGEQLENLYGRMREAARIGAST